MSKKIKIVKISIICNVLLIYYLAKHLKVDTKKEEIKYDKLCGNHQSLLISFTHNHLNNVTLKKTVSSSK